MQEAGATARTIGARLHAGRHGIESTIRAGMAAGLTIDQFAPRLSFLLGDRDELLHGGGEAARRAPDLGEAGPAVRASEREVAGPAHPLPRPPAGRSPRRTSSNNVTRTCIEAMAATQGHTQSLQTPTRSTRRWRCPPTSPARIARNTQLFLQQESGNDPHHRPLGRLALRRAPHRRAGEEGDGAYRGGRGAGAAWPRRSRPACPSSRSRRRRRAPRRGSTAGNQAVIGVKHVQAARRTPRSTCCGSTTPTSARSSSTSWRACAPSATRRPSTPPVRR